MSTDIAGGSTTQDFLLSLPERFEPAEVTSRLEREFAIALGTSPNNLRVELDRNSFKSSEGVTGHIRFPDSSNLSQKFESQRAESTSTVSAVLVANGAVGEKCMRPLDPSGPFDVAVVCALHGLELAAVGEAGKRRGCDWQPIPGEGTLRYEGAFLNAEYRDRVSIVIGSCDIMGMCQAAILTTAMIQKFRPRFVLMSGIAGGDPRGGNPDSAPDKVGIGDIIIAAESWDVDAGKFTKDRFISSRARENITERMHMLVRGIENSHQQFLLSAAEEFDKCDLGKAPKDNKPRIHVGSTACVNAVVDDDGRLSEIRDMVGRNCVGVDMEIFGVYRAARWSHPQPDFVAIKAVSDLAENKDDSYRPYAAYLSAEFIMHFIQNVLAAEPRTKDAT